MAEKKHHHLVYGSLQDCLTGEDLLDTDDERIRQSLSRMMMEEKGYLPEQLRPRVSVETFFANRFVRSSIELVVSSAGRDFLIIRYGPGSLVSRERSAIAAARVLNDQYRIPLALVTNGKEAELLDTITGKVLDDGLESIPDAVLAEKLVPDLTYLPPLKNKQRERELRILNAFDLERCCLP